MFHQLLMSLITAEIGLQATVRQEALQLFASQEIEYIVNASLPIDTHQKIEEDLPLDVSAEVHKIYIQDITLPEFNVTIHDDYIHMKTEGAKAHVTFRWSYDTAIGGDDGSGDVYLDDIDISFKFKVDVPEFNIELDVDDVDCDIDSVDIDIHGSPISAVTKWLIDVLKGTLKGKIEDVIQDGIDDVVSNLSDQLQGSETQVIPGTSIIFYYDFLYFKYFNETYVSLSNVGKFEDLSHPVPTPPIPYYAPMPVFNETGSDIQLYINDYSINNLLYCMYTAEYLQYNLTNKIIDDLTHYNLTASEVKILLPGLEPYGDAPMGVNAALAEQVILTLNHKGDFSVNATIGLVVEDVGEVILFDAGLNVTFGVSLDDWVFKAFLEKVIITDLKLLNSEIGSISQSELAGLVTVANFAISNLLSDLPSYSLDLPQPTTYGININITDSSIYLNEGYLYLEGTPEYLT